MTDREALIVELLRLRADGGLSVREGVRGDDGAVGIREHGKACAIRSSGLRCTCWVRSLDELSRCLRYMRQGGGFDLNEPDGRRVRRMWYAVHERYIAAERRPMLVKIRRWRAVCPPNVAAVGPVVQLAGGGLNKRGDGERVILCERWSERVDAALADAGVSWLAVEFRGSPNLPRELLEVAA